MAQSHNKRQVKSFYELPCFLLLYSMSCLNVSKPCKGVTPDQSYALLHTQVLAQHITIKGHLCTWNAVGVPESGRL